MITHVYRLLCISVLEVKDLKLLNILKNFMPCILKGNMQASSIIIIHASRMVIMFVCVSVCYR